MGYAVANRRERRGTGRCAGPSIHHVAQNSPKRDRFIRRSGKMQGPYLVDPQHQRGHVRVGGDRALPRNDLRHRSRWLVATPRRGTDMALRRLAVTAALLVLVATPGLATDRPISGVKLVVVRAKSGREKLVFVSKDPSFLFPAIGSIDDPGTGSPGGALIYECDHGRHHDDRRTPKACRGVRARARLGTVPPTEEPRHVDRDRGSRVDGALSV